MAANVNAYSASRFGWSASCSRSLIVQSGDRTCPHPKSVAIAQDTASAIDDAFSIYTLIVRWMLLEGYVKQTVISLCVIQSISMSSCLIPQSHEIL